MNTPQKTSEKNIYHRGSSVHLNAHNVILKLITKQRERLVTKTRAVIHRLWHRPPYKHLPISLQGMEGTLNYMQTNCLFARIVD